MGTRTKFCLDAAWSKKGPQPKCPQFHPTTMGSDICQCGHGLYSHYMCGDPSESYCRSCGVATPRPPVAAAKPPDTRPADPVRDELVEALKGTTSPASHDEIQRLGCVHGYASEENLRRLLNAFAQSRFDRIAKAALARVESRQ